MPEICCACRNTPSNSCMGACGCMGTHAALWGCMGASRSAEQAHYYTETWLLRCCCLFPTNYFHGEIPASLTPAPCVPNPASSMQPCLQPTALHPILLLFYSQGRSSHPCPSHSCPQASTLTAPLSIAPLPTPNPHPCVCPLPHHLCSPACCCCCRPPSHPRPKDKCPKQPPT